MDSVDIVDENQKNKNELYKNGNDHYVYPGGYSSYSGHNKSGPPQGHVNPKFLPPHLRKVAYTHQEVSMIQPITQSQCIFCKYK